MEARIRARSGARLIAVLAMAGLAMPAIALGSIDAPTAADVSRPQARPSERPTPKPKATPTPTPVPTTAPSVDPGPSTMPTPTPAGAAPTVTPATAAPPAAPAVPRATSAPAPGATAGTPPAATAPTPAATVDPLAPIVVRGGDGGGPTGGDDGSGTDASPTSGFGGAVDLGAPIAYAAAVLLVALVIARRRLERQERATASGTIPGPDWTLTPRAAPPERPHVPDDEANLPRWLRPSLRAERFGMDQSRSRVLPAALRMAPPTRTPMAFGRPPGDGIDRRVIVAERLGLLASPGEATAEAIAALERGDEVEILDVDGQWSNVFTPTGQAGWLPTTALGAPADLATERVLPAWAAGPAAPGGVTADQPLDLAAILAAGRTRPKAGA